MFAEITAMTFFFLSASQACTYEALILKVRIYESWVPPYSSILPYIRSFNTLNCQKCVTQSLSWYLHLSDWNHKYNHFPNVGSLFCQPFQNVTVPLHFRHMNKWEAINMSLSLHSGTALHEHAQNCVFAGLRFWCPICKATKMCHRVCVQRSVFLRIHIFVSV